MSSRFCKEIIGTQHVLFYNTCGTYIIWELLGQPNTSIYIIGIHSSIYMLFPCVNIGTAQDRKATVKAVEKYWVVGRIHKRAIYGLRVWRVPYR